MEVLAYKILLTRDEVGGILPQHDQPWLQPAQMKCGSKISQQKSTNAHSEKLSFLIDKTLKSHRYALVY